MFFLVAIVCIGYPGIQKIMYENGKISIEKEARTIAEKGNPTPKDVSAFNARISNLENSGRFVKDKNIMVAIADAKLKIGDTNEGKRFLNRALEIDPNYELALVNRIGIESLAEGEKLAMDNFRSVEYYKDFSLKKKSYIKSLYESLKKNKPE